MGRGIYSTWAWQQLCSIMAAGWSYEETAALIKIWGDENVQRQLHEVARNRSVYEKVSKELEKVGFERTWQQCRTKIKNITHKYRKVSRLLASCKLWYS